MTNSIGEIRDADCILITGSNTAEAHPVISYEVVRATQKGANLIIIDPRRIPLVDHATLFLQPHPGTDIYIFLAMMHVIIREGWLDEEFIKARTEGFDEFAAIVENYTPERAALISGVAEEQIEFASRLYAQGERANGDSHYEDSRGHSTILYAMGITQRSNGTDNVMTLANLSMLCGQIGAPSTGVNPLRGQANVQGACDVGCLVNVFPGYQRVTVDESREKLAKSWKVESLPAEVGLTIVEATHAAFEGTVRAMYIMGENPMMSDPNTNHVEQAFRNLDFMVVQDIFPSETAFMAHVLLPAASSLEKDGTFTNSERRVQLIRKVISPPGEALPDWQITAAIADLCRYGSRSIRFQRATMALPRQRSCRNTNPARRKVFTWCREVQPRRSARSCRENRRRIPAHAHDRSGAIPLPFWYDDPAQWTLTLA
jgi:predicted molibdopterin-dependent oxidoreductase YjgC